MKNKAMFLAAALWGLSCWVSAQPVAESQPASSAYTVIANPGEETWHQVRINWHSDRKARKAICQWTEASDTLWKKARTTRAQQTYCTVFDSLYSKKADGENFYEQARFWQCTVSLDKLKPGTRYMYRVGEKGNMSQVRYFKTAPRSGAWTAGIISDFHAYPPLGARVVSAMAMLDTLEACNGGEFDLMLHVGDVCAWGGSYSFWRDLYDQRHFKKYLWAGVNGNHDNMDRQSKRLSNQYFRHVNNNPLNGYSGEEGVCYYFKYGPALFIMLNNEDMHSDEDLAEAQAWVREVIENNPSKYIVVMEHYQWFYGNNGRASQYNRWKDLFDQCGVDLAIGANNHIYARTNAVYQGKETDGSVGTVYIQTPSSDNERGQELKEWTDNKDLIKCRWSEGGRTVGAILLEGNDDQLLLTLYDRNGTKIDQAVVKAKR